MEKHLWSMLVPHYCVRRQICSKILSIYTTHTLSQMLMLLAMVFYSEELPFCSLFNLFSLEFYQLFNEFLSFCIYRTNECFYIFVLITQRHLHSLWNASRLTLSMCNNYQAVVMIIVHIFQCIFGVVHQLYVDFCKEKPKEKSLVIFFVISNKLSLFRN